MIAWIFAYAMAATGGPTLPPPVRPPPELSALTAPARLAPTDPHVLYLNFDGETLTGGNCSDALAGCTFIIANGSTGVVPPFGGSAIVKQQIIDLVKQYYDPFNVQVVTERPASGPYSMVMVGGTPADIGINAPGAAGIAPLDCSDVNSPSDISFAFSDTVGNRAHDCAVTIAQESAHGYGLGHTDGMDDIMFPRLDGMETNFQNRLMHIYDIGGGSSSCDGSGVQNSYRLMMDTVGSNVPDTMPPTLTLENPSDGATLPSGFVVNFLTMDDREVVRVDLYAAGQKIHSVTSYPWSITVPAGSLPAGPTPIKGVASDLAGNMGESATIVVTISRLGDTPGDLGTACMVDTDCNGGGFCSGAGGPRVCSRLCASSDGPCPGGFECITTKTFQQICVPQQKEEGCAALPAGREAGGPRSWRFPMLVLAALLVALAWRWARSGR